MYTGFKGNIKLPTITASTGSFVIYWLFSCKHDFILAATSPPPEIFTPLPLFHCFGPIVIASNII
ncbi:hypothetical protein, partial [Segatella bryantii]|uniref:hypothetical protein n=1 Tax=Segatella bryantii TaxID=77095 RepID=UPI00242D42D4